MRRGFTPPRKLAAQDQIFGFDRPPGSDREHRQADKVGEHPHNDPSEGDHARIIPRQSVDSSTRRYRSYYSE